jgi:type IV secretion system protein VirD4
LVWNPECHFCLRAPVAGSGSSSILTYQQVPFLTTEPYNRTGDAVEPGLLLPIDEAANPRLPTLPQWASTVTGAGIQLVTVWQSKAQLDQLYGRQADNVLTNHRTKLFYPSGLSTRPPPTTSAPWPALNTSAATSTTPPGSGKAPTQLPGEHQQPPYHYYPPASCDKCASATHRQPRPPVRVYGRTI